MKTDMSTRLKVIVLALIVASMLGIAPAASADETEWLTAMSPRLELRVPDERSRIALLKTVRLEAIRSGLDPQLVLGLIDVVSGFKKYAVSKDGARGFMQVSPAWPERIGTKDDDLFDMRKNIRYGCTILRHFLDLENNNLSRALGRYESQMHGLLDKEVEPGAGSSEFSRKVEGAWKTRWRHG